MSTAALARIPGVTVHPLGRASLSGPALALLEAIDAAILAAVSGLRPIEAAPSPLLDPADLRAIDYFTSFPHLVMMPAAVAPHDAARERFRAANAAGAAAGDRPVAVDALAPVTAVLAPAACYGVYPLLRGQRLAAPCAWTTRSFCFRNEDREEPLRRQRCFRMREVIHFGSADSCRAFAAAAETTIVSVAARFGRDLRFDAATDPFFDPARSLKYLHQKLFPSKREALFDGGEAGPPLAVASVNLHRNFFGEAFDIWVDGQVAHTACLAFGLERWLYAVLCAGES